MGPPTRDLKIGKVAMAHTVVRLTGSGPARSRCVFRTYAARQQKSCQSARAGLSAMSATAVGVPYAHSIMALPDHVSSLKVLLLHHGLDCAAATDLQQAGLQPVASTRCLDLVRDALQQGPDGAGGGRGGGAGAGSERAAAQRRRQLAARGQPVRPTAHAVPAPGQAGAAGRGQRGLAAPARLRKAPAAACRWPRPASRCSKSSSA